MPYTIDKSLSWDGLFKVTSESGASYTIKMRESYPQSGLWTLDFIKSNNVETKPSEVFLTMKAIAEVCKEYANSNNVNRVVIFTSGNIEDSLQKAQTFSRWMKDEWDVKIDEAEIKIGGLRSAYFNPTKYLISATRKPVVINQQTINQQQSPTIQSEIKFCFNCGTPNNSFVFCPSCGTKLKQA